MDMHLKDTLIRKVANRGEEDEDNKDFWARTGKGAVAGGVLGGLAGGAGIGGLAAGAGAGDDTPLVAGIGAALGAGIGGTIGAITPHVAVGLMAIMKKHQNTA